MGRRRSALSRSGSAAILVLSFSSRSPAQDLIVGFGPPTGLEFTAAAGVGDLDVDGFSDYAIGDTTNVVTVYSGGSGLTLYSAVTPPTFFDWGVPIWSAGDLSGDGIPEIAVGGSVGNPRDSSFSILDGASGASLLAPIGRMSSFEPCGDLTGDAIPDFLTGGPSSSYGGSSGSYYLISGADGSNDRWRSKWNDTGFGHSVAGTDDVDGDGVDDYLIGHTTKNCAYLYSGQTGNLIQTFVGASGRSSFGLSLKWMKDLDQDGVGDFVSAVRSTSTGDYLVDFISGATGGVLHEVALVQNQFVRESNAMGDLNGDGVVDLAITVATVSRADTLIEVCSGRTANPLYTFSFPSATTVPTAVRPGRDIDGDGLADLVLCHPSDFNGVTSWFGAYRGSQLWLEASAKAPSAGDALTIKLAEGDPSESTLIAAVEMNGSPTFLPIGPILNFGADGLRSDSFTVPTGLAGLQVRLQGFALGSGALRISGREEIDFQ